MKKIGSKILVLAIIAAGVVFGPELIHKCDDCGRTFVGTGYEPNVIEDYLSEEEQIICESCAREQHKLSLAIGKELDEFKRELFQ